MKSGDEKHIGVYNPRLIKFSLVMRSPATQTLTFDTWLGSFGGEQKFGIPIHTFGSDLFRDSPSLFPEEERILK